MTTPFVVLVLAAPLLLLAAAVVGLWSHGPLGWVAALLLLAGVVALTRATCLRCTTWWAGTRAPELPPGARPAGTHYRDATRQAAPPGVGPVSAPPTGGPVTAPPTVGRGPGAAVPPAPPAGTTPG